MSRSLRRLGIMVEAARHETGISASMSVQNHANQDALTAPPPCPVEPPGGMPRRLLRIGLSVLLTLLCGAGFAYECRLWYGKICSVSWDVVHHLAIIKEFAEYGNRDGIKAYLYEMYKYPGLAHYVTAKAALFCAGDIVAAMSEVTLIALLAYLFFLLLLTIPKTCRWTDFAYAVLCVASFCLLSYMDVSIQDTIFGMYFFSQLVGCAFALMALYATFVLAREHLLIRLVLAAAALWVSAYVHMVATFTFLGPCLVFPFQEMVYALCRRDERRGKIITGGIVEIAFYLLVAIVVVFGHPQAVETRSYLAKAVQRSYLAHDNLNWFFPFFSVNQLVVIASIAFLVVNAFYLIVLVKTRYVVPKERRMALSLYNGAYLLTLANWGAFYFLHQATQYSAIKHFYGLAMYLPACLIGVILDALIFRLRDAKAPARRCSGWTHYSTWAALFLVVLVSQYLFASPGHHLQLSKKKPLTFDYPRYAQIRGKLSSIPLSEPGTAVFINVTNYGQCNIVGYAVNVLDLHFPRTPPNRPLFLELQRLAHPERAIEFLKTQKHGFKTVILGNRALARWFGKELPRCRCYNIEDGRQYVR